MDRNSVLDALLSFNFAAIVPDLDALTAWILTKGLPVGLFTLACDCDDQRAFFTYTIREERHGINVSLAMAGPEVRIGNEAPYCAPVWDLGPIFYHDGQTRKRVSIPLGTWN